MEMCGSFLLAEMASLPPMFRQVWVFWDIVAMMVLSFISRRIFHHVVFVVVLDRLIAG